jgi:Fur family transcriptional regulator, peroxide stress response regulator
MKRRFSKKREAIFEVLKATHGPLSAGAIHAKLPEIDIVTIYRNLELFSNDKRIKKYHLAHGEAEYEYQSEPHHHAICTDCERVIHFKAPDEKIIKLLGLKEFAVDELEVVVKGRCTKGS